MSLEDELTRQLNAKATSVRPAPDLGDLYGRIGARERRVQRREKMTVAAAVILLAASLGGLVGALVSTPQGGQSNSVQTGYNPEARSSATRPGTTTPTGRHTGAPAASPRVVINRQLASGLSVVATVQPFSAPVAVMSEWSAASSCVSGEVVTTTVGQGGSFGGGTSVAQLPTLLPNGLEILSSGVLQVAGGGQEWWVTTAVGSGVERVAAENVGGTPVTVVPSAGIAVVAGAISGSSSSNIPMSAVAEGAGGDSSLGFLLGSGPKAVGESSLGGDASGCTVLSLPAEPSSASSSQPADPELAAGSIIAAFDQADSANPLLGFAANLAAVSGGDALSAAVVPGTLVKQPAGTGDVTGGSDAPGGGLEVRQVSFLSASVADVIYRVNGVLVTGEADLGPSGSWRVSLSTFCGNLRSGAVAGDIPSEVLAACQAQG